MIKPVIFKFLKELEQNNNREWFSANKKFYKEAIEAVYNFATRMIQGVSKFDDEIKNLEVKQSVFRIYKDVRFSKDKAPYKTNFGVFLVKNGRRSGNAGYYLHLQNNESFLAGGIYMPPLPELKKIRNEIYYHIDEFKRIINEPEVKKYFNELSGEKLIRPPKDFSPDFVDIELLKYKSYFFLQPVSDEQCLSEDFFQYLMERYRLLKPIVKFINRGLSM